VRNKLAIAANRRVQLPVDVSTITMFAIAFIGPVGVQILRLIGDEESGWWNL
jgi:hypothetical protein